MNDQKIAELINCPNFQKQFSQLCHDRRKISRTARSIEKSIYAEVFDTNTNALLDCQNFDPVSFDCMNCRIIANINKRSASSLLKVSA